MRKKTQKKVTIKKNSSVSKPPLLICGLGRMGAQIARRLHVNGFDVVAWNRSLDPAAEMAKFFKKTKGGKSAKVGGKVDKLSFSTNNLAEAVAKLDEIRVRSKTPRIIWVMLPHATVDDFIFGKNAPELQIGSYLAKGDIVIDGGNSFYKDSIARAEKLAKLGIIAFDSGTSGGIWGERNGFALMIGGPKAKWPLLESIFRTLSASENYGLVGGNGAGHFVKMVHNGIEYGMMEAIGEGYGVLEASPFKLDLAKVTRIYQQGSVVRSWLIDLCRDIFEKEDIAGTVGIIDANGEGEWTVNAGREFGVDVRVIADSLAVRTESKLPENQQKFSNKIVALMRKQFGGHGIQKKVRSSK